MLAPPYTYLFSVYISASVVTREEVKEGSEGNHSCHSSIEIEQEACCGTLLVPRIKQNYTKDTGTSESFLYNTMFSKTYVQLKHACIAAHSVKTAAFTIKAEHEKNPRKKLDFINQIGGWGMSTYADIKLPNELHQVV